MSEEKLAKMKAQVYKDPRPKECFDRFHERARTREPDWVYTLVRILTSLYGWTFFRARGISAEKVPASGPVIIAPNHFSFMDHFFLGASIRRKVRFMAKSQLFKRPMQFVYSHGGGCVAMYCEGGRSRSGKLSDRVRPGIGRLALESGATVVPVAIHGSSKVRNWRRLQFPKVTVQYGEPIRFERVEEPSREQQQATADAIFAEIRDLYDRLDAHGRAGALARAREERRAARRAKRAATA